MNEILAAVFVGCSNKAAQLGTRVALGHVNHAATVAISMKPFPFRCLQSKAHAPTCAFSAPLSRQQSSYSVSARRRAAALGRASRGLRTNAVDTAAQQSVGNDRNVSTSYSNGASDGEDLTYAMNHASPEVLRARFEELLNGTKPDVQEGEKVQGVVLRVTDRGAFVEIGRKSPAYLHSTEMTMQRGVKPHEIVKEDSTREFIVSDVFSNGDVLVSLSELEEQILWGRLLHLQQANVTVHARGVATTNNGLVIEIQGVGGFLPKRFMDQTVEAETLVGKDLEVKILEATEETSRLIVAQKMLLPDMELNFNVGDVIEGKVSSVRPYGAFVSITPQMDALLHVSQVSSDRINDMEKIFAQGDVIKAMVLTFDKERRRVNLSTSSLEKQAGDMLRNPAQVFANADAQAAVWREKRDQARALSVENGSMDV
ncbi:hypothetical protein WJX73_001597 [Symbiochloris irregularis]|uniref:S1 motif domain-containing protein n=1 Tax=Symbiochloris irregularis TaxID=706552 RepID=A0AAW1PS94_9CHLO